MTGSSLALVEFRVTTRERHIVHLNRVRSDGEDRLSGVRVEMLAQRRSSASQMPASASSAEADLWICKSRREARVRVRTWERDLFPCQEVDDLAAVEVGDAELLPLFHGEGEAMACLDDGAGHAYCSRAGGEAEVLRLSAEMLVVIVP